MLRRPTEEVMKIDSSLMVGEIAAAGPAAAHLEAQGFDAAWTFEGPHDRIELRHEARDRGGFARGAVEGALWIHGRTGVFGIEDWLRDRFNPTNENHG